MRRVLGRRVESRAEFGSELPRRVFRTVGAVSTRNFDRRLPLFDSNNCYAVATTVAIATHISAGQQCFGKFTRTGWRLLISRRAQLGRRYAHHFDAGSAGLWSIARGRQRDSKHVERQPVVPIHDSQFERVAIVATDRLVTAVVFVSSHFVSSGMVESYRDCCSDKSIAEH